MGRSGMMAVLEQHGWPQGPCWSGSPGCSAAHRKIAVVCEATPITSADTVYATNCIAKKGHLSDFNTGRCSVF